VIPHVFHRGGKPILDLRGAWWKASASAGVPGRIPMISAGPRCGTFWARWHSSGREGCVKVATLLAARVAELADALDLGSQAGATSAQANSLPIQRIRVLTQVNLRLVV